MEKHFTIPKFPLPLSFALLAVLTLELIIYGMAVAVPLLWVTLMFGLFYIAYLSLFRRDALPLIFTVLFFSAHHSLLFYTDRDMPIAVLFMGIFVVNSGIMWFLLHYATHLKREHHSAYSLVSGFMIAQIITLFATMARDWPFRFELASYMPTVFSYLFWRFACLQAESMLGWKQFKQLAFIVIILVIIIILGSPNVQV